MEDFRIRVKNKFEPQEPRRIIVYNSSDGKDTILHWQGEGGKTSEVFPIPYNGCSGGESEHYLLITAAPRPGEDKNSCKIGLPLKAKLKFLPIEEKEVLLSPAFSDTDKRTSMIIEDGPHTWQLKVTRPPMECCARNRGDDEGDDDVTVGGNG